MEWGTVTRIPTSLQQKCFRFNDFIILAITSHWLIGRWAFGQDRISREKAGQLMECGTDIEKLAAWLRSSPIEVTQLPMAIVGSGNSNLSAKIEALCHSAKLDISSSPRELERYSDSLVSFCSDFGTEYQIPEVGSWECAPLGFQNSIAIPVLFM